MQWTENPQILVQLQSTQLQQLPQIRGYQSKVIRTSKQAQMIQVLKCVSSQVVEGNGLQNHRTLVPQGFESFLACLCSISSAVQSKSLRTIRSGVRIPYGVPIQHVFYTIFNVKTKLLKIYYLLIQDRKLLIPVKKGNPIESNRNWQIAGTLTGLT